MLSKKRPAPLVQFLENVPCLLPHAEHERLKRARPRLSTASAAGEAEAVSRDTEEKLASKEVVEVQSSPEKTPSELTTRERWVKLCNWAVGRLDQADKYGKEIAKMCPYKTEDLAKALQASAQCRRAFDTASKRAVFGARLAELERLCPYNAMDVESCVQTIRRTAARPKARTRR